MCHVVFLRAVNVGGHQAFRPAALAREIAHLDAVNVGAAGTFVVRASIGAAALRAEISRRLPFETEVVVCRGSDVLDLARVGDAPAARARGEVRRFVSVMAKHPRTLPRLPLSHPAGDEWQVKIVAVSGPFAVSLWRRTGRTLVYPNAVVEKQLGVPATTRNWNTVEAICKILASGA